MPYDMPDLEDKLILLAMIDGLGGCTRDQLLRFAVEARLLPQFRCLLRIGELLEAQLIRERESAEGRVLILQPEGRETLRLLGDALPQEMRARIDENAPLWRLRFRDERQLPATWQDEGEHCRVILRALEDGRETLRIELRATSKAQAQRFCSRWPDTAAEVYGTLIAALGEEDAEAPE